MILDNKNNNKKVYQWLEEYTDKGAMDIVTGYFTVGALAYLSKITNEKINAYRIILGDIVSTDIIKDRAIDLLNENISADAALKLSFVAKEAVEFLKQNNVEAKTMEPNFCHAKVWLFHSQKDERHKYFISGSSNLTEAGIGLKTTNNIELNIAETGDCNQYKELTEWFSSLWASKEAHRTKTIIDSNNKKHVKPFKEYLINAIEQIFVKYSPKQLYYKVLFEIFGSQLIDDQTDPEFNRQIGRLENTVIYKTLYDFQQKGVLSLIKMLQKYNGAILADAVGLGKTWSALAVMKFFQLQGREIILICPKKLQHNWNRYKRHQNSKFEKDQLEYFVRYHTDMHEERMEKYNDRADKFFVDQKPKLFVIDESHNLRNSKSQRYNFLVKEILAKNEDAKVLMLSATPINNTLIDIRNQFKLINKGQADGFNSDFQIRNIDHLFNRAQHAFFEWRKSENPKISDFIKELPRDFFRLTDSLTVARTRQMIEKQKTDLFFPKKCKPENLFVTPRQIGNLEGFEDIFDRFPPVLSGYQPAIYVEQPEDVKKIHDEKQRDRFLVKMMYILLTKRLESSWFSFASTVNKVLDHHQNALQKVANYQNNKHAEVINDFASDDIFEDEENEYLAEFSLGKKRPINLIDIDEAGNLINFKSHLKSDIEALDLLKSNLQRFADDIENETKMPGNHQSKDEKLQALIARIKAKRQSGCNNNNQKVLIFTVYKDTAMYLYEQLIKRGFSKIGVVTGDISKEDSAQQETKNFEPILERFAPFTKLFNEKEWDFKPTSEKLSAKEKYDQWQKWIAENDLKTYQKLKNPIDILIATDTLSEGQNLQDSDMVINYDIHWNPVRIVQRIGRIDRLGSPNEEIFGVNFWPTDNINSYLNLKGRIEERMAMMKLAGSEIDLEFSDSFRNMATDSDFEDKLNQRMLKQMQTTMEDIEVNNENMGFDKLSLEDFRQDLLEELNKQHNYYNNMPKGVYTGFKANKTVCPENGLIAFLGYPAKPPKATEHNYKSYELIYINAYGKEVVSNQKEVLNALSDHKDMARFVDEKIDKGDQDVIEKLQESLKQWMITQAGEEEMLEDGTITKRAGKETKDLLKCLKTGDSNAIKRVKENVSSSEKYQLKNFDLIAWFLVS